MDVTLKAAEKTTAAHRILLLHSDRGPDFQAAGRAVARDAHGLARLRKFEGNAKQTLLLHREGRQWLFAGLGEVAKLTRPIFCEAVARAFSELRAAGGAEMALLLPEKLPWPPAEAARYAAEALLMAGYSFHEYRTSSEAPGRSTVELVHPGGAAALRRGIREGDAVGRAIALTRDLINHPAGVAHTDFVRREARRIAKAAGAKFQEIRGDALLRKGYRAIHAVGRSGPHPPALAALEYGRRARGRPTVALVGKGVVFDSGGLDLKTTAGMALMKKDLGGAAIVLGAFQAIAGLKVPVHLVAVVGLAENAVGPDAYHPGDVLASKSGPTIEITNTDAEGRVVLADAFALAREYKPDYLIDFATLTGACRTALGKDIMGLFCEEPGLRRVMEAAGEATGDHLWPLPLWQPYRAKLNSTVADLANAAADGFGGAITAALFLREFTGDVAWAHLDCYGWSDGDSPLFPKGGSGVGVRLAIDVVRRILAGEADARP